MSRGDQGWLRGDHRGGALHARLGLGDPILVSLDTGCMVQQSIGLLEIISVTCLRGIGNQQGLYIGQAFDHLAVTWIDCQCDLEADKRIVVWRGPDNSN